jgi:AsmA-like C-terminal region
MTMKGRATRMDIGPLFQLSDPNRQPPISGKLFADFNLWADTNTDFFATMAGSGSIVLRDGRLERFTLLSRLLGLIDLKNWLTASVPDPRETGLPFKSITADFAGTDGSFYTGDLLLEGPVMDVTADGSVDVGRSVLDMQVGMLPFQTVSWLMTWIPLVGTGMSQGTNIIGAYFHVRGPVTDPRVTPMPFTSAAEFIKKTLGMPINIIRPNTVK